LDFAAAAFVLFALNEDRFRGQNDLKIYAFEIDYPILLSEAAVVFED